MARCDALQKQCIPLAGADAKPRGRRLGRGLLAEPASWFGSVCRGIRLFGRGQVASRLAGYSYKRKFDRSHALRGNASWDAPRPGKHARLEPCAPCDAERHVLHSHAERGNDRRSEADEPRSHAPRGNASWDAPRPGKHARLEPCAPFDAERHGLHSHAGAWERSWSLAVWLVIRTSRNFRQGFEVVPRTLGL